MVEKESTGLIRNMFNASINLPKTQCFDHFSPYYYGRDKLISLSFIVLKYTLDIYSCI